MSRVGFLNHWQLRRDLQKAQWDARHIGNAFHFVVLGDILRELGQFKKAEQAYVQALQKEPQNQEALWGKAVADAKTRKYASAKEALGVLLTLVSDYKSGDASLLYGRVLFVLKDLAPAKGHFAKHLSQWNHSQGALYLCAYFIRRRQA